MTRATLWRWRRAFDIGGVGGLVPGKRGPKKPSKLTDSVIARIKELDSDGRSLADIGGAVGVDTATVRVALGRRAGSAGWEARKADAESGSASGEAGRAVAGAEQASGDAHGEDGPSRAGSPGANPAQPSGSAGLAVVPMPAAARRGARGRAGR